MVMTVFEEVVWEGEVVSNEVAQDRDVLDAADVVSAVLGRRLLPVPPESIQVRMVEEEKRLCG